MRNAIHVRQAAGKDREESRFTLGETTGISVEQIVGE
jgi:hypothetical protein